MSASALGNTTSRTVAAVVQMCSTADVTSNLACVLRVMQAAAARGARSTDFIAESASQAAALAEPLNGPFVSAVREEATKLSVDVMIGVHEKINHKEQASETKSPYFRNALLVLGGGEAASGKPSEQDRITDGQRGSVVDLGACASKAPITAVYRKIHLFDVDVPNGPRLLESATCEAGHEIVDPVPMEIGNVGLAICYDMRFPSLAGMLRSRGANVLLFPSAFTLATGGAGHWDTLLRARALDAQCYVLAAAQVGRHNAKRESYGAALAVDPWGQVLARCPDAGHWSAWVGNSTDCSEGDGSGMLPGTVSGAVIGDVHLIPPSVSEAAAGTGAAACFALVDVDHSVTDRVRKAIPVQDHLRRDLYSI